MKEVITDSELVACLENIKQEIQSINLLNDGRIVFLNLEAFYNYINDINFTTKGYPSNIKNMIKSIEPFIPMNVSENHLELFMMAASKKDENMIDHIDKFFDKISKITFINSVYQARTPQSWNDILKICRSMRNFHEEESIQAKRSAYSSYFSKFF